jgi:putative heme-binding domain-containing protein
MLISRLSKQLALCASLLLPSLCFPAPPAAAPPGQDKPGSANPVPLWIWGADTNQRYFLRKEFTGASPTVTTARLKVTCDNRVTLFLNGQEVARSHDWQRPVEVDVKKYLKPDKNVLLAEVVNEGGPAGFVLKLVLEVPKAEPRIVVSDETWEAAEKKDAARWVPVRKIARLGDQPWNDIFARPAGPPAVNLPSQPTDVFQTQPGFKVERIFTVPRDKCGSWVSLTVDDQGRLIACDQGNRGLYRITPPRIGSDDEPRVEPLHIKVTAAQGLLYANGCLYISVNGGPEGSGLYRARSTRGNDYFDEVVKLKTFGSGGEHGVHGLRLAPDGKSIFLVAGNHTPPPDKFQSSRLPRNWSEDHLLPRQWDTNGHARGILAPGGWIARTDFDGQSWEIVSSGYRNAYDIAFNADGELFAYDADMEWDMGMPWYRPTRLVHATSGSELGWRSGTGKWPAYYLDSLPPLLDVGPGSPVGIEFGYGTRFPAKYQKALFCCDWTFGTIYAMHLEPEGSSYKVVKEEFLSRTPLPLTDITVGADGALYFTIGGRGAQSELFRVTYLGKEPTERVEYHDPRGAELRALRHQLEQLHGGPAADPDRALAFLWPYLGHTDRFIRYAARVALEHQPVKLWQERALVEQNPDALLGGIVALARQGDRSLQPRLLAALDRLEFASLTPTRQLDLLRALSLVFIRMGQPDAPTAARLANKLNPYFPASSDALNRELCAMLVYLKAPAVVAKALALMKQESKPPSAEVMKELLARNRGYGDVIARLLANGPDIQKLHYAFVLRNVREGWTVDQRKAYFQWLADVRQKSGGASYLGFLNNMEKDAFDNASDAERLTIEALGLRKPYKPRELPKPVGPGRDWQLDELVQFAGPRLKGRDFKNGQKMYAATRCVVCHRFNGEGGATGPDLTQVAGRFNLKDLGESIIEPSKVIADQYKASLVVTTNGRVYVGRIVSETKEKLILVIDPEDSTRAVELKKSDIDEMRDSPVSLMPAGLLNGLNDNEVLDLLAYLLSRGDPGHALFRK